MTVYGAAGLSCSTVAIAASKLSFAVTLIPLTSSWTRYYVYFAIVTTVLVAIPTAITPWVQCTPLVKTFVDFWPGECINKQPSVTYGEFASGRYIHDLFPFGFQLCDVGIRRRLTPLGHTHTRT